MIAADVAGDRRRDALILAGIVAIPFAALTVFGFIKARESFLNGPTPHATTVAVVTRRHDIPWNYVSVIGEFYPVVFRFGEGERGRVKKASQAWAPLLDTKEHRGLFVQVADSSSTRVEEVPRVQTITGMLRPMDTHLKNRMKELGGKLGPIAFDTDIMLVQGDRPGSLLKWGAVTICSAVLLFALPPLVWIRMNPSRHDASKPTTTPTPAERVQP